MWQSWLIVALRALARHRLFSALNIGGLAVGMAACLLIARWVHHETHQDAWVPAGERVFVVASRVQYAGQDPQLWRHAPTPMLPALAQDFAPQVEAASRVLLGRRALRLGERLENQMMLLADPGFFRVLPWPVLEGSTDEALARPGQLVVTERFARQWFGARPALGQVMTVTVAGRPEPQRIVAVLRDPPPDSLFDFDVVALLDPKQMPNPAQLENWGAFSVLALVRLRQPADAAALQAGGETFVQRHAPQIVSAEQGFRYRPELLPLQGVHLAPVQIGGPGRPPGDRTLVAAVAATGLLVLVIATITYVNLATARVSLRAREVGLRKTLGATRAQLVAQFLVESTVLAALAGVLALALVELALPAFNALLGQQLELRYLGAGGLLLPLAAMVLFVGLAGGWYPALVLSRLAPRQALVGRQVAAGGGGVRAALVVGQFAIAVALASSMLVIDAQVRHLRSADIGYEPRGLVVVSGLTRAEVRPQQQALLEAFQRVPGVLAATRSMFEPTGAGISRQPAFRPGAPDTEGMQFSTQPIDWNYVATYRARLLAGRDLGRDIGGDDTNRLTDEEIAARGVNVLINRAGLRLFGLTDPRAAVGQSFQLNGESGRYTATVVGVIENIRLRSLRDAAEPEFYGRDQDHMTSIAVRFADDVPPAQALERLQAAWRERLPDSPFMAAHADEAVAKYYAAEARTGHLFALFAGLAIALCAVGVYGLAVFTAERRTREIGLRKLFGARVADILRLLLWQFSKPVLLALALACPFAAWWMARWLSAFDTRIALTPWPFVLAGLAALAVALATVSAQALKVARTSPIHALRHD
jgi:putative ABC transport system permease protein